MVGGFLPETSREFTGNQVSFDKFGGKTVPTIIIATLAVLVLFAIAAVLELKRVPRGSTQRVKPKSTQAKSVQS